MSDTKITLEMSAEAAARLLAKYKENPDAFREHFKEFGIISVEPTPVTSNESNSNEKST